jgi:CheY-like chemotaxis protein
MEEDVRKGRDAGLIAHVTKPVDLHALQHAIQSVTSSIDAA